MEEAVTSISPKQLEALALEGGDAWLVLADLAYEHGREDLGKAATLAASGRKLGRAVGKLIRGLDPEQAITVAVRAARRALERERVAGREPDQRSWTAVKAVEAGKRGKQIANIADDAWSGSAAARAAASAAAWSARSAAWAAAAAWAADAAARAAATNNADFSAFGAFATERLRQLADIFRLWWETVKR